MVSIQTIVGAAILAAMVFVAIAKMLVTYNVYKAKNEEVKRQREAIARGEVVPCR